VCNDTKMLKLVVSVSITNVNTFHLNGYGKNNEIVEFGHDMPKKE